MLLNFLHFYPPYRVRSFIIFFLSRCIALIPSVAFFLLLLFAPFICVLSIFVLDASVFGARSHSHSLFAHNTNFSFELLYGKSALFFNAYARSTLTGSWFFCVRVWVCQQVYFFRKKSAFTSYLSCIYCVVINKCMFVYGFDKSRKS